MFSPEITWIDKIRSWFRHSLSIKLFSIGVIMLLLMIPNGMVQDLINERKYRQTSVIQEVSSKWGEAQLLVGPILTIPYHHTIYSDDGKSTTYTEMAYFLPDLFEIDGEVFPEIRNRSIYKVNLYKSDLSLTGSFGPLGLDYLELASEQLDWSKAKIIFGIPDMTGIEDNIFLNWGDASIRMQPGISKSLLFSTGPSVPVAVDNPRSTKGINANSRFSHELLSSGVSAPVSINEKGIIEPISFSINLQLKGSQTLHFAPIGKETNARISSDWTTPSFSGTFLPDDREINENGFSAQWKILDFNRNYPQQWIGTQKDLYRYNFGLRLLPPIDEYQKNTRSSKYAFLLISLSFLVFFFFEIISGLNIHSIQYIFIGLAISVFYVLLLSLSEHIGFNKAYWASAFATVGLIVGYSSAILKNKKRTGILAIILTGLYAFIFIILQLEDYALLAGSIGLFAVLAIAMLLSRKIDWYQLKRR